MLALFAFNWYGYRLFMNLLEQKASTSLQQQLDQNQYDDKNLVEVKIPVNMPYLTNWNSFEKYEGETEINGVHYKFVKRKLVNDTLVLLCIPNETKNELRTAQSDYFKMVNDLQSQNKKSNSGKDHTVKVPFTDYLLKDYHIATIPGDLYLQHHAFYLDRSTYLSQKVAEQPPDC